VITARKQRCLWSPWKYLPGLLRHFCSVFLSPPAWVLSAGNRTVCRGFRRTFICCGSESFLCFGWFLGCRFFSDRFCFDRRFRFGFYLCFCRRLCDRFCLSFGWFRCCFYWSLYRSLCFGRGLCRGLRRFCRNLLCCRHTYFLPFKFSIPPHWDPSRR